MTKVKQDKILRDQLLQKGALHHVLFKLGDSLDKALKEIGYKIDMENKDLFLVELKTGDVYPLNIIYIDKDGYVKLNHFTQLAN